MKKTFLTFLFVLLCTFVSSPVWAQSSPPVETPRVLFISVNPTENGKGLVETYFSSQIGGNTPAQRQAFENATLQSYQQSFKELSQNMIQYSVAKKLEITTFPPLTEGARHTFASYQECLNGDPQKNCETKKWKVDYVQFFQENNICQIAKENNIDEIWMMSTAFVLTYENFMVGPTPGFDVNGPSYMVPGCEKHYIIVNPIYELPDNFFHNYGHRVEATFRYLTQGWQADQRLLYWERFARLSRYSEPYNGTVNYPEVYCGNTHFPHNAVRHYDTGNTQTKNSSCKDWSNIPDFTNEVESMSCDRWGCNARKWDEYWLSVLPRKSGSFTVTLSNTQTLEFYTNWWEYILRPERVLACVKDQDCVPVVEEFSADFDKNGKVDLADFSLLNGEFLEEKSEYAADANRDGKVDLQDYSIWSTQVNL